LNFLERDLEMVGIKVPSIDEIKSNLELFRAVVNSKSYRHGRSTISVSDIAEQFYCEYKLDLRYREGDIPTRDKDEGNRLHEKILSGEKVSLDYVIRKIRSGRLCIYFNFPVWAIFEDLALIGELDAIIFERGKARYIIELKTSRKGLRIFEDAIVQIQIYGLCIESMGFDCSELELSIVKIKRELLGEISAEELKRRIIADLLENKIEKLERAFNRMLRVHIENYDRKFVEEKLRFVKDYWLEIREPYPTNNPNKCKSCYYREFCPRE